MNTCKRCGEPVPKHWVPDGNDVYHIDCWYIYLGEKHGKESAYPEAEGQPPSSPVQKQRWWRQTLKHIYGILYPARSVAQIISKLPTREDSKYHQ